METGEGERLHSQQRKRFWSILAALAGVGLVAGFASGFAAGFFDAGGGVGSPIVLFVGAAGVALFVVAVVYGSWSFFVNADEVEVSDNLWASLIGFYFYAIAFPAWWCLSKIRVVGEPNDWVIYAATIVIATGAYAFRKWQSR
ncbi:hypothetical protein [Sphingomonas daechungensis]|uniref:hypothetical protein n=1 Tax=Sphingomonas daechungensis TaxID=1176646 RepID=UPI00378442DB